MRWLTVVLVALLGLVHAALWFGRGGLPRAAELERQLQVQREANDQAQLRNQQLDAEVRDLQEGLEIVEEKARYDLGMVKRNEILVQIIE